MPPDATGPSDAERIASLLRAVQAATDAGVAPDLRRWDLSGLDLAGALSTHAHLSLAGALLDEADLSRADLSGVNLSGASLNATILFDANLTRATLTDAHGANTLLWRARLNGAKLARARFADASFEDAQMDSIVAEGLSLRGCNLIGANLTGADLRDARLWQVTANSARFTRARLSGAIVFADGANFDGANDVSWVSRALSRYITFARHGLGGSYALGPLDDGPNPPTGPVVASTTPTSNADVANLIAGELTELSASPAVAPADLIARLRRFGVLAADRRPPAAALADERPRILLDKGILPGLDAVLPRLPEGVATAVARWAADAAAANRIDAVPESIVERANRAARGVDQPAVLPPYPPAARAILGDGVLPARPAILTAFLRTDDPRNVPWCAHLASLLRQEPTAAFRKEMATTFATALLDVADPSDSPGPVTYRAGVQELAGAVFDAVPGLTRPWPSVVMDLAGRMGGQRGLGGRDGGAPPPSSGGPAPPGG